MSRDCYWLREEAGQKTATAELTFLYEKDGRGGQQAGGKEAFREGRKNSQDREATCTQLPQA